MNVLSICSGIGGLDLFTKRQGWRTSCYVEINPYRQAILHARMRDGWLDSAPIWPDLRTFDGMAWRGSVDCIVGGFPCQPFSTAGKQRGADDPRNLWPEVARLIREVRPRFAFLENVPGLLHGTYWGTILGDLAESGYDVQWDCVSANAAGAPHRRDRLWILASDASASRRNDGSNPERGHRHPPDDGAPPQVQQAGLERLSGASKVSSTVANPSSDGLETEWWGLRAAKRLPKLAGNGWWETEPTVGRVAYGVPARVDRLAALGDAVVHQQAELAWRLLTEVP